jgi:octaheme c-type cytochrome (tetrathionate reductase family)
MNKKYIFPGIVILAIIFIIPIFYKIIKKPVIRVTKVSFSKKKRDHLDHSHFFKKKITDPKEVTKECLKCHKNQAHDLMKTVHWKWESEPVKIPGKKELVKIGKKNLVNNFCIGISGNQISCTSCHAGYGWKDKSYNFKDVNNVDCLICHDWSGTYVKGDYGYPKKSVDLQAVAKSVGYPKRDNCGICHIYGGGGMGVKHGDLDNSLINPHRELDVHMGGSDLLCIDCHKTDKHKISGTAYSVSVDNRNGINCTDCHKEMNHQDRRINKHLDSVACQTCHIPDYAKKAPTKTDWDWSKAGDSARNEDKHHYLKIKGEFLYGKKLIPEYRWFNMKVGRYLYGDKLDPTTTLDLNPPQGNIKDKKAKIWPFKIHRAKQPYDLENLYLLQPVTSGDGGYWHQFDWKKALELGEEKTGVKFSGNYDFIDTNMYWPLSHMVSPKEKSLKCFDCHGENSRFNWKDLGYKGDPINIGGRYYVKPKPVKPNRVKKINKSTRLKKKVKTVKARKLVKPINKEGKK